MTTHMTAIEMKYALFREIDSIEDESMLNQIIAIISKLLNVSKKATAEDVDKEGIPEFIKNMSVKTGMTSQEDVKGVMHRHWEEKHG